MNEPIRIADYDPAWPSLFDEERTRVRRAIGHLILDIQHVGATSVPECSGKPIIDIMVGVSDLTVVEKSVHPLVVLGYEYLGEYGLPGRHYFRKGSPRTHHLHMVLVDSDFWKDHTLFRDYLRASPADAKRYGELKKELAAQFGTDREGYTEAKSPFIQSVLARARAAGTPF